MNLNNTTVFFTGSIQVYYDATKTNSVVSDRSYNYLKHNFNNMLAVSCENIAILRTLHNDVIATKQNVIDISEGDYYSVIGDVFLDSVKNTRMLSGFQCLKTSAARDVVWLDELKYLYDKYYIKRL